MGYATTATYVCDQCGKKEDAGPGGMTGPASGGPTGWVPMAGGTLWFHSWECVRDYADERLSPADTPGSPA